MFAASERVREDIGKAAIMRGPVVCCLEEKDNGKNLHELLVDTDMHASVSEGKICDTVVKMVETDGWRLTESGDAEETLYHMYQKPQFGVDRKQRRLTTMQEAFIQSFQHRISTFDDWLLAFQCFTFWIPPKFIVKLDLCSRASHVLAP